MLAAPSLFRPARGLAGPHAQTIFANVFRPRGVPPLVRERWDTADGDVLDVDWLAAPRADAPHLLILHGLEGSSEAGYVRATLAAAAAHGLGALALNFRGCLLPNRTARRYHAGDTDDARAALARLRERTRGPLGAVGFSLGGNVLAKLLGEDGEASPLAAAATVSAPFDLAACARTLDGDGGLVRVYRLRFLRQLRAHALEFAARFPGRVDLARVRAAASLRAFDDAFTAPLHGFADVADYYARASSGPLLPRVARPLHVLHADDDPIVPGATLPRAALVAHPHVTLEVTAHGGHVGFVGGSAVRPRFWAEDHVVAQLAARLAAARC